VDRSWSEKVDPERFRNEQHELYPAGPAPAADHGISPRRHHAPLLLWWTDTTVGQLKEHLGSHDPEERAYWMGALLREANTRDVWLFVTVDEIREFWPLIRYLGRSRQMSAWLLKLPPPEWPPLGQIPPPPQHYWGLLGASSGAPTANFPSRSWVCVCRSGGLKAFFAASGGGREMAGQRSKFGIPGRELPTGLPFVTA
jgi:hypothetical protein